MDTTSLAPIIVIAFAVAFVCGAVSYSIAQNRGLPPGGYFIAGFLFGILGVIIAACARPAMPPMACAPGWYPDPWQQARLRWHDGYQWTAHLA